MFIDVFIFEHIFINSYKWDFIVLSIVWVVYEIICVFGIYVLKKYVYTSANKNNNFGKNFCFGLLFYFMYLSMYLIYQVGLEIKMGIKSNVSTVSEKSNLI